MLLQTSGCLLAMEASDILDGKLEGPQTPLASGASDPQIFALLDKFSDVFAKLVFLPSDHITHDITLLDPDAQPPKPKQYYLSPAK